MTTKSLEEVKDKLYKAFDAAEKAFDYVDQSSGSVVEKVSARAQALQSMAQLADSIGNAENNLKLQQLLAEAKLEGSRVVVEINQGLSKDVKPLSSIKLKTPGQ